MKTTQDFNIFLMANFEKIKELQKEAITYKLKTFGEVKTYISNYYKKIGITFEPSILILSCDNFEEYRIITLN